MRQPSPIEGEGQENRHRPVYPVAHEHWSSAVVMGGPNKSTAVRFMLG
jgi:hypothetical protein